MSNYGRHDYRDPAREKFGKPAIAYPDGSLLHPTLTEVFDHRKDSTTGALPYLSLSQNPRAQGCHLTRQSLARGDDDSVNLTLVYERLPGVVKTSYPVDETYKIATKVQTQVVVAQENPPWAGARTSAEIVFTAVPGIGETVTVGSVTYSFVESLTGADDEVLIAPTIEGTLFNLSSAINQDWGAGVNYGAGTTANPNAAGWFSLNTLVIVDTNAPSAPVAIGATVIHLIWPVFDGGEAVQTCFPMFIETRPIDTNRMYRIASRVMLPLPADQVFWMTSNVELPDTLLSLTPIWNESRSGSANSQDSPAMAQASASHMVDAGVGVEVQNGYRGPAKARLTRRFTLTPPDDADIASPTIIKPSLGTVAIQLLGENISQSDGENGAGSSASGTISTKTLQIGPVLTGTVGLVQVGKTGSAGSWGGKTQIQFNGVYTLSTNPASMDTVTIGLKTYLFQSSLTDADGHVQIGTAAADTLANLFRAINAGAGGGYAASTTPNSQVRATNVTSTQLSVAAYVFSDLASQGVFAVTVDDQGSGYTSVPAVSFSGGGGSGAAGHAVAIGGKVAAVVITNQGSGYTSAPAVSFSGGGGSGAAATATIGAINDGNGVFSPADVTSYSSAPNGGEIYDAAVANASARGILSVSMPGSTPPYFSSGDTILEQVNVQQWRLGLYIIETIEVTVP